MAEQLQSIAQFLQARIRTVAFLVAAALLAVMFFFYLTDSPPAEGGAGDDTAGGPPPTPVGLATSEALQRELGQNKALIESSEAFARLMRDSMFNPAATRQASNE